PRRRSCGFHPRCRPDGGRTSLLAPYRRRATRGLATNRGQGMKDVLKELERRRETARLGGGPARIEAQHRRGKLTARERLDVFLDEGSFEEFDMFVEHRSTDFGMERTKI